MPNFTEQLILSLFDAQFVEYDNNHDFLRFGPRKKLGIYEWLKFQLRRVFKGFGFYSKRYLNRLSSDALEMWVARFPDLEWLYCKLGNEESKKLLIQLIAYRLMGPKAIILPLNSEKYWQRIREFEELRQEAEPINISFNEWKLYLYDLSKIGFPIRLYIRPSGIMNQFELQQYSYRQQKIFPDKEQIILDCGGCYGDTALNFAHLVGKHGKVYTFEFVASNLKVLHKNINSNPSLAERIEIVENPLWSRSNITMFVDDNGPASRISFKPFNDQSSHCVVTITIDDFVEQRKIRRIDLIKMDIEGAEFEALKGAEKTLKKFKPSLAIAVYHKPEHFTQLAQWIDRLEVGYCFYLDHFTIHAEETILFAKVKPHE